MYFFVSLLMDNSKVMNLRPSSRKFKVFVSSDQRQASPMLIEFLKAYQNYELHFIPTVFSVFDIMNFEPDIIVLDPSCQKIVKCYEWGAAA